VCVTRPLACVEAMSDGAVLEALHRYGAVRHPLCCLLPLLTGGAHSMYTQRFASTQFVHWHEAEPYLPLVCCSVCCVYLW
jgi:hypothetical protein